MSAAPRYRDTFSKDDGTWRFAERRLYVDWTETRTLIDPRFEGRGLASDLIRTALSEARSEGLSVTPFCPFVRGYIGRHREYVDLVPADVRARFELADDV